LFVAPATVSGGISAEPRDTGRPAAVDRAEMARTLDRRARILIRRESVFTFLPPSPEFHRRRPPPAERAILNGFFWELSRPSHSVRSQRAYSIASYREGKRSTVNKPF
jgi:hypothetical protein